MMSMCAECDINDTLTFPQPQCRSLVMPWIWNISLWSCLKNWQWEIGSDVVEWVRHIVDWFVQNDGDGSWQQQLIYSWGQLQGPKNRCTSDQRVIVNLLWPKAIALVA